MQTQETFDGALVKAQSDLTAYVVSMLPFHRDAVADVVQETNLALVAARGQYDASRPFLPWAVTFAKHQVLAYLRDAGRERVLFSSDVVERLSDLYVDERPGPAERSGASSGFLDRLRICRQNLKEGDRLLLSLFYDRRMTIREISQKVKRTEGSLRFSLSDIRRRLGNCIRKLCRLPDEVVERSGRGAIRQVLDAVAEDGMPSASLLNDANEECRHMEDDALQGVLDELRVDALLRGPFAVRPVRRMRAWVRPLALAAACLALLAGGGVWWMTRVDNRVDTPANPLLSHGTCAMPPPPASKAPAGQLPLAAKLPGPAALPMPSTSVIPSIVSITARTASGAKSLEAALPPPPQRKESTMKTASLIQKTLAMTAAATASVLTVASSQRIANADDVPVVSGVTFRQPFNSRTIEIGYTLANGPAVITLDITTNGASIGDANLHYLKGAVNRLVSNGTYTVTWDTKHAWPGHTNEQARAVVTAWCTNFPPDYLVANLNTGDIRYYTSADALPGGVTNDIYKTEKLTLRKMHASHVEWTMGSAPGEWGRRDDQETNQFVTLPEDYYIGIYEITQGQWYQLTSTNISYFCAGSSLSAYPAYPGRPEDRVSFVEIRENSSANYDVADKTYQYPNPPNPASFLGKLRTRTGVSFDLPSEAQWEYACRAGTIQHQWNDGSAILRANPDANLSKLGRYAGNRQGEVSNVGPTGGTAVAGSYLPNAWGVYDMHGNVWEFCLDGFENQHLYPNHDGEVYTNSTSFYVAKGGCWANSADRCRSAVHATSPDPATRNQVMGLRVAAPASAMK